MKSRYLWLLFSWLLVSSPVDSARAQTAAKWQARSAMATARSGLMAVEHQGRIYVIGGRDANGDVLDLVERYNPASDTWETFPSLRKGRENGAAVVYNGQLMVIGGHTNSDETTKDVEVFDEGENRWVSFSGLDEARQGLAAVVLHGELYVVGGSNENEQILTSVESYDPNDTKWVPSDWVLDIPRASFTAVTLGDSAYALGGFNAFGPMNLVQLYTSELGTIDRAPLAVARGGLSAVTLDGRILALGGRKANNQVVASVDRYDPVSNSWQALAPLNAGRESFAAVTVGDEVYVFGGEDTAGNALSSVESYSVLPAPSAIDDALVLDEDVSASVNVLINDSDPLGGALAIGGFSQGAHGAVTKVNNSTLQYVPAPNYAGSDSFTYTAVNQSGISSTGTVSVTVRAVNDPPAFVTSPVEGALTGASYVYDVTVGDVDGDALTLGATVPAWLSLVDNGDGTGTLAGTPTASELGSHNVVLTVGDGTVTVQQAFTVTVVAGAPAAPVLTFPADGALDMALRLALTWSAPGASTSDVQVSTSSDFSTLVVDAVDVAGVSLIVDDLTPFTQFYWRVRAKNAAGASAWTAAYSFSTADGVGVDDEVPARFFSLHGNFPNPFSSETRIPFEIGLDGNDSIRLTVHDVQGRLIAVLADGYFAPGSYEATWNGRDHVGRPAASGLYIYTLQQGSRHSSGKLILLN